MSDSKNGGGKDQGGNGRGPKRFEIKIDRTNFKVESDALTAEKLRQLPDPDIGADRDLFEVVPGGSDIKIEADMIVAMRNGLRFFTAPAQINPGKG